MSDFKMKLALLYLQKKMNGADVVDYIDTIILSDAVELVSSGEKDKVRISTVLIEEIRYKDISDYLEHINGHIKRSVEYGAELITFPQLIGMLPLRMIPPYLSTRKEMEKLSGMQHKREYILDLMEHMGSWLMEIYVNSYCSLAEKYNVTIHAGSILVLEKGKLYNRSYIFNPMGDIILAQDKLYLSEEEKQWGISCGEQINIAITSIGSVAVFNDADSLYYENFKIAREMGAKIVLFSHITEHLPLAKRYLEAVSWRCDEQGIYVVESGYIRENLKSGISVICPANLSKKQDGIYFSTDEKGAHVCTLTYSRLKSSFDSYSTDKNSAFYQKVLPKIYSRWNKQK